MEELLLLLPPLLEAVDEGDGSSVLGRELFQVPAGGWDAPFDRPLPVPSTYTYCICCYFSGPAVYPVCLSMPVR